MQLLLTKTQLTTPTQRAMVPEVVHKLCMRHLPAPRVTYVRRILRPSRPDKPPEHDIIISVYWTQPLFGRWLKHQPSTMADAIDVQTLPACSFNPALCLAFTTICKAVRLCCPADAAINSTKKLLQHSRFMSYHENNSYLESCFIHFQGIP